MLHSYPAVDNLEVHSLAEVGKVVDHNCTDEKRLAISSVESGFVALNDYKSFKVETKGEKQKLRSSCLSQLGGNVRWLRV